MSPCPAEKQGLEISEVSRETFLDFIRRHATSEEIGRIGTCLDADRKNAPAGELLLLGLMGCSKVCAVLCCQIVAAGTGNASAKVCKLDSVVVHSDLRKRGLATVLVSKAFAGLLDDGRYDFSRYYSHAVHPATVKLLAELGFTDPPLLGAPICTIEIDDANREEITTAWNYAYSSAVDPLRLNCALCKSPRKQGRRWCTPSPSAKLPQAVSANNAVAASS